MTLDNDNNEQSPQSKGWTAERRAKHSRVMRFKIQDWKPWSLSTGPKSAEGKKICSRNALRHGYRSSGARKLYALMTKHRRWLKAAEAMLNFRRVEQNKFANRLIEPKVLFPLRFDDLPILLC